MLLVMALGAFSQDLQDMMPPSPTAASIIKAGEINANKFTGTPNISIPLYSVAYHNMSVPIALSYDARGIKVDDVPGWVGTNWSLSAGGVITRMVRGLADDRVSEGYFTSRPAYEAGGLTKVDEFRRYDRGERDGDPDIYNFSFPGGSGKFMIDHNKKIHVFPHQRLKVEFLTGTTVDGGFRITTTSGTTYTFDAVEYTQVSSSGNLSGDSYVSSWYLSKIENAIYPGKYITFSYVDLPLIANMVKLKSYSATRYYHGGGYFPANQHTVTSTRFGSYETKRLTGIQWGTGSVDFVANTGRLDLAEDNHLDKIVVKDDSGVVVKEYALSYGYYSGENKLRLDSVQEFGDDQTSYPPYVFTYEGSNLPDYNSTGQDYWGYYNGKDTNVDLLPVQWVDVYETYPSFPAQEHFYRVGNADRQPDENFLKKGLLETIKYPTGGTSEFEMESHRYSNKVTDLLPIHFNANFPCALANVRCDFVNDYDYLVNRFGNQILNKDSELVQSEGGGDPIFHVQTQNFSVVDAQRIVFDIDIEAYGQNYTTTLPYVKLEKQNGANWDLVFNVGGASTATRIEDLAVGTYRMTAYAAEEFGDDPDRAKMKASWYAPTGNTDLYGPGLRVKRISQREDPAKPQVNIREFEYTDENGASSGLLYSELMFSYRKHSILVDNSQEFYRPLLLQSSSSRFQHFQDPIGYSRVTEVFGENGENGKIVDIYNTSPQSILDFVGPDYIEEYAADEHPFAPSFYATWNLGQLLESTVYRKKNVGETGTDYKKLTHTKNTWNFAKGEVIRGLAVASVNIHDGTNVIDLIGNLVYQEINYGITPIWDKLIKTEQTTYSTWETPLTTITDLIYGGVDGHLQVVSQSVTGSDGIKNTTEYSYPLDYYDSVSETSTHPFANGLVANNMQGAVIEELMFKGNGNDRQIIGGKITKYDATALQPHKIFTLKVGGNTTLFESGFFKSTSYTGTGSTIDGNYEGRIKFKYDNGNLVEQALSNGQPMSYVWGYDNQYPVAQIQNADYSTVSAALVNANLGPGGLNPTQETALRNLPNTLVSTMAYQLGKGMILQTDPNGLNTTFEYDAFGRLKLVRDPDGNIVNTYQYHYKGQ